jgi:hypothetical protein
LSVSTHAPLQHVSIYPQAGLHPPPLLEDVATPLLDDVTAPLPVVFAPPLLGLSTTTEPQSPRASSIAPMHPR